MGTTSSVIGLRSLKGTESAVDARFFGEHDGEERNAAPAAPNEDFKKALLFIPIIHLRINLIIIIRGFYKKYLINSIGII